MHGSVDVAETLLGGLQGQIYFHHNNMKTFICFSPCCVDICMIGAKVIVIATAQEHRSRCRSYWNSWLWSNSTLCILCRRMHKKQCFQEGPKQSSEKANCIKFQPLSTRLFRRLCDKSSTLAAYPRGTFDSQEENSCSCFSCKVNWLLLSWNFIFCLKEQVINCGYLEKGIW